MKIESLITTKISVRSRFLGHLLSVCKLLARESEGSRGNKMCMRFYLLQSVLQRSQLALFHHESLVVQVLDDIVMLVLVDFEDDGLDGGITFDEYTYK